MLMTSFNQRIKRWNSNDSLCLERHASSLSNFWSIKNNSVLILNWLVNNEFNQSFDSLNLYCPWFPFFLIDHEDLRFVDDLGINSHAIRYRGTGGRTIDGILRHDVPFIKNSSRIIWFLWLGQCRKTIIFTGGCSSFTQKVQCFTDSCM